METTTDHVTLRNVELNDGRTVVLFVNLSTNLVVLDIVDADEQGGIEIYRRHV